MNKPSKEGEVSSPRSVHPVKVSCGEGPSLYAPESPPADSQEIFDEFHRKERHWPVAEKRVRPHG